MDVIARNCRRHWRVLSYETIEVYQGGHERGFPVFLGAQGMLSRIRTRIRHRDFAVMGRAITARHARCRQWWAPHLACSRLFLNDNLPQNLGRVAVLGAGRLLDIDLDLLLDRCQEVYLFDADPACERTWKKRYPEHYGKMLFGRCVDITNCLASWTAAVRDASSKEKLESCLQQLQAPTPRWSEFDFDGCISLNILSQIPLYWRDRVMRMHPVWGHDVWQPLCDSMDVLQTAHLRGVMKNSRYWNALVTDTEYYFYNVDSPDWDVESALFAGAQELYNSSYEGLTKQSWWWHLAPQFIEDNQVGEIHRVEATVNITGGKECM